MCINYFFNKKILAEQVKKISQRTMFKLRIYVKLTLHRIRSQKKLNQLKIDFQRQISSEQIEYANDHFARVNDRTIINNQYNDDTFLLNFYNSILYLDRDTYIIR